MSKENERYFFKNKTALTRKKEMKDKNEEAVCTNLF